MPWDKALEVQLPVHSISVKDPINSNDSSVTVSLVDLEPGTPYCLRFVIKTGSIRRIGPETVFDTKPLGCAPEGKKKNCIVC